MFTNSVVATSLEMLPSTAAMVRLQRHDKDSTLGSAIMHGASFARTACFSMGTGSCRPADALEQL